MNSIFHYFRKNHILAVCEDAVHKNSFTLNLSRFEMTELPKEVENCNVLMKIFLNHNQLTTIPSSIAVLSRLQVVALDYNKLTAFPNALCDLVNLRSLNVSCNSIKQLPAEIGNLTMLEIFWCNNTGLEALPCELGNCVRLITFGARGNKLKRLPNSIGQLEKLRWLTLENNELTELPDSFKCLKEIVHLNLSKNRLIQWPSLLSDMIKLRFVFIHNNCIEKTPEQCDFSETRFMRMLKLDGNPFCLKQDAINEMRQHNHIYFGQNEEYESANQNLSAGLDSSDEDEDDGEVVEEIYTSDWKHSVVTSDLNSTSESTPENDLEEISMMVPELSRYITNFS